MPRSAVELLDVDEIQANLKTRRIGRKILVFNSTSSTNDAARRYIKSKNSDGLSIFAEEQTAGKGRGGNKWLSKRSESILCSIILFENNLSAELLSLTSAVAVADSIGKPAKIKWPNDIIINDKKVAGILLEAVANQITNTYIIGIGINCHQGMDSFPVELGSKATSIDMENNKICDRIVLAKRLLCSLDSWLETAINDNKKVLDSWRKLSIQLGHRVSLSFNRKNFSGNCIGIDPEKGLVLQLDTGGVRMFDAAHTTIIKR
jgi:BirA family transcriptional regulator, biotin operon repressor / biotin---[acetyl-CoA-carboxylase] ligase